MANSVIPKSLASDVNSIKNSLQYKSLISGGISGNGQYTLNYDITDYNEIVFVFILGGKYRQSVVYSKAQVASNSAMPDIYLAGARAYFETAVSGRTLTVSNYHTDSGVASGSWALMGR